jgi:hypothetical protein
MLYDSVKFHMCNYLEQRPHFLSSQINNFNLLNNADLVANIKLDFFNFCHDFLQVLFLRTVGYFDYVGDYLFAYHLNLCMGYRRFRVGIQSTISYFRFYDIA